MFEKIHAKSGYHSG